MFSREAPERPIMGINYPYNIRQTNPENLKRPTRKMEFKKKLESPLAAPLVGILINIFSEKVLEFNPLQDVLG